MKGSKRDKSLNPCIANVQATNSREQNDVRLRDCKYQEILLYKSFQSVFRSYQQTPNSANAPFSLFLTYSSRRLLSRARPRLKEFTP